MIAFLRDANDSQSVLAVFDRLYLELHPDIFMSIMPLVLTDNGSEFSNPRDIEFDRLGNPRTRIFYCVPSSTGQKGAAEKNHEFIRYVLPKGTSFDSRHRKTFPCSWIMLILIAGKALAINVLTKCLNFFMVQMHFRHWDAIGLRQTT